MRIKTQCKKCQTYKHQPMMCIVWRLENPDEACDCYTPKWWESFGKTILIYIIATLTWVIIIGILLFYIIYIIWLM